MALSNLGQIALRVSHADRPVRFYGQQLGLPFLFRHGELACFDCAGVRLMLEGQAQPAGLGVGTCHCFKVTDIAARRAERPNRGEISFRDEPHLVAKMPDHELWMTFFQDPDGPALALMEEKHRSEIQNPRQAWLTGVGKRCLGFIRPDRRCAPARR